MNIVKVETAILMMQKNEKELLDKWIKYHSEIFSLTNLYVFDNGSDNEQTKELLLNWEQKGLTVNWGHSTKQDFENKGKILGETIKELEKTGTYECFIPLDCDEFLAVQLDKDTVSCEPEDIYSEILSHSDCKDVLLIDAQFFNSPISRKWFHRFENRKCFFMKDTFESMDVGFHWGKVKNSTKEKKTHLVQFHFHNKPFQDAREHARNKLALRVESFDKEYLATYKGSGRHLTKYFLLSEQEYLKQVLLAPFCNIGSLANKFDDLAIEWPYNSTLEYSLSLISPNSTLNIEDIAATLHRRVRGSVDQISLHNECLRLDGWSSQMDKSPIVQFILVGESGEQEIAADVAVFRADIAKLFGFKEKKFGFIINIPLDIVRKLGVVDLKLHPKLANGEVSPALSVNKKYQGFIQDMNS